MTCLAQIKKIQESFTNSALMLERTPELLEARFALTVAPPRLRTNASTYLPDPAIGYLLGIRRNCSHRRAKG